MSDHKKKTFTPPPTLARVRESQIRKGGADAALFYSIHGFPSSNHSDCPLWRSLYPVQRRITLWTLSTSKTLHKENLYENFRALPGNAR
nr:MAG TPA: hypothetical protein [Caudoviricetes sp.]